MLMAANSTPAMESRTAAPGRKGRNAWKRTGLVVAGGEESLIFQQATRFGALAAGPHLSGMRS